MLKNLFIALAGAGVALLVGTCAAAAAIGSAVPLAVPAGITLVDVVVDGRGSRNAVLWRRLGDAEGNPLLTYTLEGNSGKSSCYGECAKQFPPYLAVHGASTFGDWSLLDRPEGKQWVYQGQPLYTYAGPAFGKVESDSSNGPTRGFAGRADPGGKGFSPKAGWSQAVYDPAKRLPMPADIHLESDEAANGYAFVVTPTGMPLYILKSAPKDPSNWTPLYASSLALPVGNFSQVRLGDGTHQWAYAGQLLYTYSGDYSASDINGMSQKGARIALASRFSIPKELAINVYPTLPPMVTTAKGLAVYTEAPYHLQYGGRETRGGYRITYKDGKSVGTLGCVGECIKTWRPVLASANAVSSGFWEVVVRPGGSKQWAYRGAALYTYVGDGAAGDINGNNKAVIVYGDPQDHLAAVLGEGFSSGVNGAGFSSNAGSATSIDLMSLTGGKNASPQGDTAGSPGAGFYWHLVPLVN